MSEIEFTKKYFIQEISKINEDLTVSDESYNSLKDNWLKQFIISDLTRSDKIDILNYSQNILEKFKKIKKTPIERKLFQLISKRKFHDAVKFCDILSYKFPEKREYVKSLVKQRDIYLLSPKLEMVMGGLGHTVRHRANYLEKNGYNVTIVNAGPIKNYRYILDFYHNNDGLSPNIKFHNLYDYYSKKNSLGKPVKNLDESIINSESNIVEFNGYEVKKTFNNDNSLTLDYYSKWPDEKIRSEIYIDESLIYSKTDDFEKYFTPDGFNYLKIEYNPKKVLLNDRTSGATLEFRFLIQFLYHYLNEICLESDEKPFIICDSTAQWYNMNGISLKNAFKIGAVHGNPFIDHDPDKGLNPKVPHFQKIHLFDKIVLLSSDVYDDLKTKVDADKLVVIPNFLLDEQFEYEEVEKDLNTVSIFSRIDQNKQISHIIKAFKIVSDKKENIKLDIYGDAPEKEDKDELITLTKELEIEDKVNFKGHVSNVAPLMRKNLFTVLTSKTEGLPMSLIESMANSSTVISYDIKYGPKDIITDNVDGILIKKDDIDGLAESMLYLLDNPEIAIEMGKKAKEKAKNKYSSSIVGAQWEDLFIDIFAEKEIESYYESITLKNNYNRIKKDNKKLKDEIKTLNNEIEEIKKTNENTSPKLGKIKNIFNKK